MKRFKFMAVIALAFTLTACSTFRNQGVGLNEHGTTSAYNNLDRHGAIALFDSQKGQACYKMISNAFSQLEPEPVVQSNYAEDNQYSAISEMAGAMKQLATEAMKYASHMVAYSNGITPEEPIVQLARLCKNRNYYDFKVETQAERQKTFRHIVSDVKDALVGVTPYAALANVAGKIGDRNTVNGNNNAYGDDNGVSTPTVVEQPEPTIVEQPEPIIVPIHGEPVEGEF